MLGLVVFRVSSGCEALGAGCLLDLARRWRDPSNESPDRTTIRVDGLDEGENAGGGANPVQLINGTCDDPGQVVFELEDLSGSTSETNVDLGLVALQNGEYAVQVGLTQNQPEIVACGEVPQESPTEEGES